MNERKKPYRVAGVFSGRATTVFAIQQATKEGGILHGVVELVLGIATTAMADGINKLVIDGGMRERDNLIVLPFPKGGAEVEQWAYHVHGLCRRFDVDHFGLYGCIPTMPTALIQMLQKDGVCCTNQHPAWPREFGGVGMIGKRAVAAQLLFERMLPRGNDFTAAAVCQDLDPVVDGGRVLHFGRCPILPDDDPESLQKRLLAIEHEVQIEALRLAALGELVPVKYPSPVKPGEERRCEWAKRVAFALYREGIPYRKSLAQLWAQQAAQ